MHGVAVVRGRVLSTIYSYPFPVWIDFFRSHFLEGKTK